MASYHLVRIFLNSDEFDIDEENFRHVGSVLLAAHDVS